MMLDLFHLSLLYGSEDYVGEFTTSTTRLKLWLKYIYLFSPPPTLSTYTHQHYMFYVFSYYHLSVCLLIVLSIINGILNCAPGVTIININDGLIFDVNDLFRCYCLI